MSVENEPTKEELLECVDYVNNFFKNSIGFEFDLDHFSRCVKAIQNLIEKHVE